MFALPMGDLDEQEKLDNPCILSLPNYGKPIKSSKRIHLVDGVTARPSSRVMNEFTKHLLQSIFGCMLCILLTWFDCSKK